MLQNIESALHLKDNSESALIGEYIMEDRKKQSTNSSLNSTEIETVRTSIKTRYYALTKRIP